NSRCESDNGNTTDNNSSSRNEGRRARDRNETKSVYHALNERRGLERGKRSIHRPKVTARSLTYARGNGRVARRLASPNLRPLSHLRARKRPGRSKTRFPRPPRALSFARAETAGSLEDSLPPASARSLICARGNGRVARRLASPGLRARSLQ